jgi:glycosyltransferase involved in cell wall biosynthesis
VRILHVNKFVYRRGGAESYMLDVVDLQRAAGHDVEVFGMRHDANPPWRFEDRFPSNVELNPMPDSLPAKLHATGRMFWSFEVGRRTAEVLDDFRPDVVHFHNVYHQLSPSVLRPAAKRGIATVMTLHDYKLVCPTYLFLADGRPCEACLGGHFQNAIRKRCKDGSLVASAVSAAELWSHTTLGAYGAVRRFICPSRFLLGKLEAGGVFPDRLRHVPHFAHVGPPPTPGARHRALYAGRLSYEKGVDIAIRAVGRVPDLELDVAGDGPERAALEALAAEVAPGRVRFHGLVDRAAITRLLGDALAMVVASRVYENQPMAVLEAYGAGVPVVGSDLGGVPELVQHGVAGLVYPPGDDAALAAALAELAADPQRAAALGAAGREIASTRFSPERHLAALEEVYAEAGVGAACA